jgi:hypothetical protein
VTGIPELDKPVRVDLTPEPQGKPTEHLEALGDSIKDFRDAKRKEDIDGLPAYPDPY